MSLSAALAYFMGYGPDYFLNDCCYINEICYCAYSKLLCFSLLLQTSPNVFTPKLMKSMQLLLRYSPQNPFV